MSAMRDELLRFVSELRAADLRISVAESLDAMRAVTRVGLERIPMREALAATLVKDEADRPRFDAVFVRFFGTGAAARGAGGRPGPNRRLAGTAGGRGEPAGAGGMRDPRMPPAPDDAVSLAKPARATPPEAEREADPASPGSASRSALEDNSARDRSSEHDDDSADNRDTRASSGESDAPGDTPHVGDAAGRRAGMRAADATPFAAY
ncbi:MAG TPA: hypothetical protein VNF45_08830, partial [Candidatus Binataceae bacterium]|nr:hypothetical protein [Candidatus Binataceae bacterium]